MVEGAVAATGTTRQERSEWQGKRKSNVALCELAIEIIFNQVGTSRAQDRDFRKVASKLCVCDFGYGKCEKANVNQEKLKC